VDEVTDSQKRSRPRPHGLSQGPANDIQDVLDIAIGVALFGRVPDASLDMVFEDEKSDGVYRCPQSRRLLEDVDAVFTALDHALDATDLARDAAQPPNQDRLIA
jgi:DUF971 family protein